MIDSQHPTSSIYKTIAEDRNGLVSGSISGHTEECPYQPDTNTFLVKDIFRFLLRASVLDRGLPEQAWNQQPYRMLKSMFLYACY